MMVVPGWISVSSDSFSVVGPVVPHCMDSLPDFMSWYRKEQEVCIRQGEGHGRAGADFIPTIRSDP